MLSVKLTFLWPLQTNFAEIKKQKKMNLVNKVILSAVFVSVMHTSCTNEENDGGTISDASVSFSEKQTIKIGGEGAAEISAYDPTSKNLFTVNVENTEISVTNIADIYKPVKKTSIALASYGSPNSVAVHNGKLAVAVEAVVKQQDGKILVYDTTTLQLLDTYTVGALPDMVTFTKDGKLIISANEGEPNDDYTVDPEGTISIIDVATDVVTTLDFKAFNSQEATLKAGGYRVFGPGATLAQDTEPEYVAVSEDSKTAWVSLQENNGMAKVNLVTKTIEAIYPLGFKDHSLAANSLDVSDKDGVKELKTWPVKGMYQPDAITAAKINGVEYVISANEGDSRDYSGFSEEARVKDLDLDLTAFPLSADYLNNANLGRLKITTTMGDANNDGKYEALYTYGARSFSIWTTNGTLVYDSGNSIAKETLAYTSNVFNGGDDRSDDKGAEPESVQVLTLGKKHYLFVGLERNNQVLMYDISNPTAPVFLNILSKNGDVAPEGLLIIEAKDSPTKKDLLVVSNEVSGTVTFYENN